MDFQLTEEQQHVRDLARRIAGELSTPERLAAVEADAEPVDDELWATLAQAGLVGIALPEPVGGSGLGMLEACLVLEELGAVTARVPYLATVVTAALPVAAFGGELLRRRLLGGVADGSEFLTAALSEPGQDLAVELTTLAAAEGDGWRLDGEKAGVPYAGRATRILVPARAPEGVGLFLVDPRGDGVELVAQRCTSGEPQAIVRLTGAAVAPPDVLVAPGEDPRALEWVLQRALTGLSALQAGVCRGALERTADYVSDREQFGRPIGAFQAVAQRVADAYIDVEAMRLTVLQAAWLLDAGQDCVEAVATAKFWAADGAHRVLHAAQHLHGGTGVDLDYPLHRHFLLGKQLEFTLGGATQHLLRLGELLASQPV